MNNHFIRLSGLLLIFSLAFAFSADAQSGKRKKSKKRSDGTEQYFDESGLKHKLWYGGGFNLGFSGNGNSNLFGIGISPMVGYKLVDKVSVGPRVSIDYTYIKGLSTDQTVRSVNLISYAYGAFSRWKFLPMLFAHVEYQREHLERPLAVNNLLFYDGSIGAIATQRSVRNNVFIGAGYNSSFGAFGYEILLLYNATLPEDSFELPFDIRFGFTYNF